MEIQTVDESRLLKRAICLRDSRAIGEGAYDVSPDAKSEIHRKCELATDVVLSKSRLDENNQIKQAIEDSLYKGWKVPSDKWHCKIMCEWDSLNSKNIKKL